jgi:glycosyltransferase involved in cell wall biosynthesis
MLWQLFYFAEAGVLADHLLRRGAVHLHNHFGDASCTVTMLAAEMADLPFSYTMHGPDLFFEPYKWRIDEKTARARFVVCISHFCRSQAMLFSSPQHWPKLRIVHCGVTPASYGQRVRSGFSKRVFFIGRLDPVKGGPPLLEAFASVYPRHEDARLVIVGDGSARADLEARAASLGIAGAVDFLGFRSQAEVAELLGQADMLVLPSFAEGVPVVLMEAMASRVPTLASRIAGIPELVQDGTTGFLVPPGDVPSLARQLDVLLSDPDLCGRMGVAGRQVVEAEFDVDQESAWLLRLFQSPDPASERHDGTPR